MHCTGAKLAVAATLCAALTWNLAPSTALARDQQGLGIGANLTLLSPGRSGVDGVSFPLGVSGLALDIWLSPDLLLEFIAGFSFAVIDRGDAPFAIGGSGGIFAVLAEGADTNLMLGGRLGVVAFINYTGMPGRDDNQAGVTIDGVLRVQHWFDDHFAINCQVGLGLTILPDTRAPVVGQVTATTGLFGGAGFTYYFDASGGERPRAPGGGARREQEPARSGTGQSTGEGGDTPYWER